MSEDPFCDNCYDDDHDRCGKRRQHDPLLLPEEKVEEGPCTCKCHPQPKLGVPTLIGWRTLWVSCKTRKAFRCEYCRVLRPKGTIMLRPVRESKADMVERYHRYDAACMERFAGVEVLARETSL